MPGESRSRFGRADRAREKERFPATSRDAGAEEDRALRRRLEDVVPADRERQILRRSAPARP